MQIGVNRYKMTHRQLHSDKCVSHNSCECVAIVFDFLCKFSIAKKTVKRSESVRRKNIGMKPDKKQIETEYFLEL